MVLQRRVLFYLIVALFGIVVLIRILNGRNKSNPFNGVPVVMILATHNSSKIGGQKPEPYLDKVVENREEYARAHGYDFVLRDITPYEVAGSAQSWAKLMAIRDIICDYPRTEWFWWLDQDAIIMNPEISLEDHILERDRLDHLMLRDVPIVPPDSVIRTLKGSPPDSVQFIVSHDHQGLNTGSFLLRNGDMVKYLLDVWHEPMYRSYGFERAEVSALEHIVQWHYTILSKIALVPKRVLASYNNAAEDMAFKEGDFVVLLDGCGSEGRSCEKEFLRLWNTRGRVIREQGTP